VPAQRSTGSVANATITVARLSTEPLEQPIHQIDPRLTPQVFALEGQMAVKSATNIGSMLDFGA
jgi:hypothetical protein